MRFISAATDKDILYLENWIHNKVRMTLKSDTEHRGISNVDRMARCDMETYQQVMLRCMLQYAYENSSFYREQFHKAGITPKDIHDRKDLSQFPLTEPQQIAEWPYRFLCISRAEIARIHTFVTSGTTGPQKKIFWTQGDLERITDFMAAGIGTVANREDVVQIFLPDGRPYSQADLLYQGVKKFGAMPILSGMHLSASEHLALLEKSHSTILFGYTSRLFRISKEVQAAGDLCHKGVKALFLAAEYLPEAMRRELAKMWNCRIHTHYGLTEMGLAVAVECEAGNGYHFNEADLLLEIIDPQTGKPVAAGQEGELVFTTLNREAMPLIRYRTRDISRIIQEPCACGAATLLRIDKVKKRLELIVTLASGDEVYPTLFDDLLYEIPGLIDYRLAVIRHETKDLFDFKIEMQSECLDRLPEIRKKLDLSPIISKNIAAGRMEEPHIELLPWGALKTAERAKKMIIDHRSIP
jgi:phenylacetate-CoA ligase